MTAFAELDIAARTDQLVKAKRDLDALTGAATKAEGATERLEGAAIQSNAAMAQTARSAGAMKSSLSNVGFQVQDFAVQVAAGASASQALAQQLPQLLSGFGLLGIALGTASAVLIPIAGDFLSSADGARTFSDAISDLDDAVSALQGALDIANAPLSQLIEEFGVGAVRVREMNAALADLLMLEALDKLDAATDRVGEGLEDLRGYTEGLADLYGQMAQGGSRAAADIELQQQRIQEAYGITAAQATGIVAAMDRLGAATGAREQAEAARALANTLLAVRNEAGQIPPELRGTARAALEAAIEAEKIAGPLQASLDAAQDLAATSFGGDWLGVAIERAQTLAGALWSAVTARNAAGGAGSGEYTGGISSGRGGDPRQFGAMPGTSNTFNVPNFALPVVGSGSSGGGGGGGGGAGDGFEARLDALVAQFEAEQAVADEWYNEAQAVLADRRALEILGEEEHRALLLSVEEEYQRQLAEIQAAAFQQRLSDAAGLFGALADIASAGGAKSAKAVAAFQAIEGTINAYGAAIKALNTPGISLAGRFAAYASVLGAGLKGVAAIRAAGGVGGGGGSAGGGSRAPTAAPEQAQNRFLRIEVNGEGMFAEALRDNVQSIADAITDLGGRGGTTIVVGR